MVLADVVDGISKTLGHLECASTTTSPKKGPAKSTWILYHGFGGHVQGCKVAGGGACLWL